MRTDDELLEAWREGDRDAGDALFGRHFDAIYDFFDRKVQEDVSDLVQRTFLGCLESLDRFRGDCSPRTYLFAIARNELYAWIREKQRDRRLDFSVSSLRDLGPSPSSALVLHEDAARLMDALESIPLEQQVLIELRFWQDLKHRELAVVLELPPGSVAGRLHRALANLRERLASGPTAELDDEALAAWTRAHRPAHRTIG